MCHEVLSPLFGPRPDPFAPVLRGRDYGLLTTTLHIDYDLIVSATWLQNFNDGSALAVPTLTYLFPNGWLEIAAAAQLPLRLWGDHGELKPGKEALTLYLPQALGDQAIDLSGLVPNASIHVWSRLSF